eukprot:Sdes_comp20069_c0_seq1m12968
MASQVEMEAAQSVDQLEMENTYIIRPNYKAKFKPYDVQNQIQKILQEKLTDLVYNSEDVANLTRDLTDEIRNFVEALGYERYKYLVQVTLGEKRGEGVKMCAKCFWDSDTDNHVQATFMNESIFCVAAVFGVYYY